MKSWVKTSGLVLITAVIGCLPARAQLATFTDQPPAPDSAIRLTAEAQGLSAISYENLPRSGTYWEVMPSGVMAPLPCPPLDSSLPIYLITKNIFLVDATKGEVAIKPNRFGMQAQTTASSVDAALESLATSVVNLIDLVMNPPAQEGVSPMMRMSISLSVAYAYGNSVYLANPTKSFDGYGNFVFGFTALGGTNNFMPWDIEMSTNLTSPYWTWQGIAYTTNSYAFYGDPSGVAFYRLVSPTKTMSVGFGDDYVGQCEVPYGLTNSVQLAGGGGHTMALTSKGQVLSWGWNYYGQTNVPAGLSNVVMIAAGYYHSVALLTNGSVIAWGLNSYPWPLAQVPSGLTNATVISALSTHTMALRSNGTVVVWGYDQGSGVTSVPVSLTNVTAISAGGNHCLAVSNGFVVAWGANNYGQCTVPANLSNVVDVAGGAHHSLALKANGTVAAWGRANGETTVPSGLSNVVAIAAGGDTSGGLGYSLALKKDGSVVMWGDNAATDPVGGLNNVIGIAAGADHALALRTGPPTPVITLEPMDEYQVQGSNVTFTARGAGLYGVTYQWQTNVVNLPGATNAVLTLTNVQPPAQTLAYRVIVANELGSLASSNANFSFVTPPVINSLTLPTNQVAIYQSNLVLSVSASAPGEYDGFPLSYQWQFNGTNLPGATGASYTIHTGASSFGTYSVLVSNAAGSTNAAWLVTVYYPGGLAITQQPTNRFQIAGGSISFFGAAVGSNSVTYQWAFNGTNIAGATNASLTLTNVSAAQEGYYNFVVSSAGNNLTSSNAYFYLVTPPIITTQTLPTNMTVVFQTNVALNVAATAPGTTNGFPLGYKWQFNGTNIPSASTSNYIFNAGVNSSGNYSVIVTNAAGSVTSLVWQVTMTYAGSYMDVGTLAYHLSTNAVARTNGFADIYNATVVLSGWSHGYYSATNLAPLTNAVWSTNFWLKGVQGLSATCIGYSNGVDGTFLVTMISPRHYVTASHIGTGDLIAFLDTNNVFYWRKNTQRVVASGDTSVGILDADLPSSVGYLTVVPINFSNYFPSNSFSYVQGVGMNQDMRLFSQPMTFPSASIVWNSAATAPFGLTTNWNVAIRGGDSGDPEMLLIGNQLILATHNYHGGIGGDGPNYAFQYDAINQQMHYLSTNNAVGTDYQLTPFSLTNWPTIH